MKNEQPKTVTISVRVKPEEREKLDTLAQLLGKQLGTSVTRAQAFNVAIKEAVEKRRNQNV